MRSARRIAGAAPTDLARTVLMLRSFSRHRCPIRCRIIRVLTRGSLRWIRTMASASTTSSPVRVRTLRPPTVLPTRDCSRVRTRMARGSARPMVNRSRTIRMPPRTRKGRARRILNTTAGKPVLVPTQDRRVGNQTRVCSSLGNNRSRLRSRILGSSRTSRIGRRLMISPSSCGRASRIRSSNSCRSSRRRTRRKTTRISRIAAISPVAMI
ncbi:Uncharacterised protein [Mycobacteroides abscessus subsp. abscessus]|nr:Uncharacterised protein [Mycobacteroides abscessus subsp. abscessus]